MTDISGFERFRKSAHKLQSNIGQIGESTKQTILERGNSFAQAQLAAISDNFKAESHVSGNSVYIVARDYTEPDKHIAFVEYGTSVIGSGTYPGILPSTWLYDVGGHGADGWWFYKQHETKDMRTGKRYHTLGQMSRHPMWNVRNYVKTDMLNIASEIAKSLVFIR